jgi:hypothetical protein
VRYPFDAVGAAFYDHAMPSQTDRAAQARHAALRERQRAQRASLGKVSAALTRVDAAEARAVAELAVREAERKLAAAKADLDNLVQAQRAEPYGRGLKPVPVEQAAAAREIRGAVDAFGSIAVAAEQLGLPVRTVRKYLDIAGAEKAAP